MVALYPLGVTLLAACGLLLVVMGTMPPGIVLTDTNRNPSTRKIVDRVVIVLADAMRPDFIFEELREFAGGSCAPPMRDEIHRGPHLSEIRAMTQSDAVASMFLVADPPTTTAQRLRALMTGALPSPIEVGVSFSAFAVGEDSLLRQLNHHAVVMGDDTWVELFPNLSATYVYPSLDVRDLDTNDAGIAKNFNDVLTQNSDTPLLVTHLLGLDHAGHRFHATHAEMDRKIQDIDKFIAHVRKSIRQQFNGMTMLIVLGDHGMSDSGDHGGGTPQETDTFSVVEIFGRSRVSQKNSVTRGLTLSNITRFQCDAVRSPSFLGATFQVDLVPTIAVSLGLPIPYSNIGVVVPSILKLAGASDGEILTAEEANAQQLRTLLTAKGISSVENSSLEMAQSLREARASNLPMSLSGLCLLYFMAALSLRWGDLPMSSLPIVVVRVLVVFSNSLVVMESHVLHGLAAIQVGRSWMRRELSGAKVIGLLSVWRIWLELGVRHRHHGTHIIDGVSYLDGVPMVQTLLRVIYPFAMVVGVEGASMWRVAVVVGTLWLGVQDTAAMHVVAVAGLLMRRVTKFQRLSRVVLLLWLGGLPSSAAARVGFAWFVATVRMLPQTSAVDVHLWAWVAFFAQGSQCTLSTIDWSAAYVGVGRYHTIGCGFLLLTRTFNAFLALALLGCPTNVAGVGWALLATSSTAAVVLRGHLMFTDVFAPKLLFDAIAAMATTVGVAFIA